MRSTLALSVERSTGDRRIADSSPNAGGVTVCVHMKDTAFYDPSRHD